MSILPSAVIESDSNLVDAAPSALASVLVIDDEETVCSTLKALLNAIGFDVVTALSGEEGVELLRAQQFEVVIVDLVMPGMNGIRTIAVLKEVDPDVEVIILTGFATVESTIAALQRGACDFLFKPIGMEQLRPALKRALEKRRPKAALPLYEASRTVLATLNREDLIPTALDLAEHCMRASAAALALTPSEGAELHINLSKDDGPLTKAAVQRLAQQAMRARVALCDPASVAGYSQGYVAAVGAGSVLIYPLEVRNAPLGALVLSRDPGVAKFSAFDVERGRHLVDEIVIALDNARLYRDLSHKVEELEAAKVEVARAEARARAVMETAQEAIVLLDKEGIVWDLNPKAVEMLGWAREQAVGRNLADFAIPPRLLEVFRKHLETAYREGKDPADGCMEVLALRQNGEEFPLEISTAVIETPQGKLLSTFGRDITTRKRVEEALRVSENRYRGLFERNLAGVLSCTREGRILDCNESLARMLGYDSTEDLLGTDVNELWEDPSEREEMIARLTEQGSLSNYEVHYRRRDGKPVWALLNIHQIEPKGGEGSILEGTLVDITQHKQAEKGLLLTQFSIEHASDAVAWLDPNGRIVYVNEAACRSFGRVREELLSLEIADIDPDFPPGAWQVAWERVKAAGSITFEARHITKLGQVFPVEVTANYVEFEGEEYSFTFSRDITQRKEAERQINLQITALESAANGIVITDHTGQILWVNPAFTRLTGYAASEVVGQSPRVLKSGAHDAPFYQKLWNTVIAGEVWQGEVVNRRKDGTLYTEEMTITPMRDGTGVITHFIAIKQDITERKRWEEALRESEDRYRDLVENSLVLIGTHDAQGKILSLNRAAARVLEITSSVEIVGRPFTDYVPPDHLPQFDAYLKTILREGHAEGLMVIATPSGKRRILGYRNTLRRHPDGPIIRWIGQDVTERLEAEKAKAFLASLGESSQDAIIGKTPEGTIVSWNLGAQELYGYRAEEVVGKAISILVRPDRAEELTALLERVRNGEQISGHETVRVRKDGRSVDVSLSISPVRDSTREIVGVVAIARDITERKRAEAGMAERHRLATLVADVGSVLTRAESLRQGLQQCAEILVGSIGAAFARVWIVNDEEKVLELQASAGMYTHIDGAHARVPIGKFKIGRIAESGEAHLTNSVQEDSWVGDPEWARREGMAAFAGYPLRVKGRVLGVVAAFARQPLTEATFQASAAVADNLAQFIKRKRAEESLRESEERFRATFENAGIGMALVDMHGRPFRSNPILRQMLGYSEEELSRVAFTEFTHPDDRELDWGFYSELTSGKREYYEMEKRFLKKGGGMLWGMLTVSSIKGRDGGFVCAVGMVQDITGRKRAEEALTHESNLLRALIDNVPDLVYVKDTESRYVVANLALAHLVRAETPDMLLGKTDFDFFLHERAAQSFENERNILRSGEPVINRESVQEILAGKQIWVQSSKVPLRDSSGRVTGLVGVTRDITEHKRTEAALRESEERFRELFENASDIVYTTGLDTRLTSLNRVGQQFLGYSAEEATQLDLRQVVLPKHAEILSQSRERMLRGEIDLTFEVEVATKAGRHKMLEVKPRLVYRRGKPVGVQGIARDITGRDAAEMELRHAQKLESVGRLASGIAHEINTPIQFVGDNTRFLQDSFGGLQILLSKYQDLRDATASGAVNPELLAAVRQAEEASDCAYLLEEIPRALTQTLDGVNRVATIVRAMKEFAHPEGKEMAAADLNHAILSTLTVARNELKYVADVETDFGDLPLVVCNIGDLNQVFLNLLVNAAHAVGEVVNGTGGKGTIRVRTVGEDGTVLIAIADTGAGIPEAIRSRVFDPFFTTKEVGRGTGQGLAIARSVVVERHKGALTFESEVGKGTTFYIRLPIDPREYSQEAKVS